MNIFKILAILAVVPSVAFAQATTLGTRSASPVSETNIPTEITIENTNIDVVSSNTKTETTDIEYEGTGVTRGEVNNSSARGADEETDENNEIDALGELDDDDDDVEDDFGLTEDDDFQVDSFFDVFFDVTDTETKTAVDAFLEIDGIDGENIDADTDDDADSVTFGDEKKMAKPSTKSKKPTEIIIVGSKVRDEVRVGKVGVRGWNPEKREVTIAPEDIQKGEDFLDFVGAITLSDENIESVAIDSKKITMKYEQPAKLFGFIPMSLTARAVLDEKGVVEIKFPWYTFLTKNNAKKVKKEIEVESLAWGAITGGEDTDLQDRARRFQIISNVLKVSHDTLKASVQNIR